MAGLTATGLDILRLDDIRTELEESWRGIYGNADFSPESPDGMLIGIIAEREASLWELAEAVYSAGAVDSAVGTQLDDQAALSAVSRRAATNSTVTITCTGTPGTLLLAGRVIRLADTLTRWLLQADATIGGGGTVDAVFAAEETGPLVALSGSAWTIVTPVAGWSSATNALDAEVGTTLETDESLRVRRHRAFVALGDAADAILAALIRISVVNGYASDVVSAHVVENETGQTDADGRPAKSFEAIVRGGSDQDIVDVIWATKPTGIETYGLNSGVAIDSQGNAHTILYTRTIEVPIWIELDLTVNGKFPNDGLDLVAAEILAFESELTEGDDVIAWSILQKIETAGIVQPTIRIGLSNPPLTDDTIEISGRQLAVFDSSRITVRRIN